MSDEKRRLEISWVQAMAGALAAVSSAVLLSTVGVAGTVIGAAIGSVAATVGGTVYSHYLAVSRDRVAAAAAARSQVRRARVDVGEAASDLAMETPRAEERLDEAEHDLQQAELGLDAAEEPTAPSAWREAVRELPWRRLLLAAAAVFVAAMVAIVAFELISGRAVSSYTGGSDKDGPRTSVPGLGGGDERKPKPSPTPSPAEAPSTEAPSTEVSPTPTESGTGTTAPSPSETPTSTPSVTPSTTPTGTSASSPTPSPSE
ncbi:MAG: hypothetical protein ACXWW7_04585 [Nocardioides sp.]